MVYFWTVHAKKAHSTKLFGYTFVSVYFVTLIWLSSISADIIVINDFPETENLISGDFRIWTKKLDFEKLGSYVRNTSFLLTIDQSNKEFMIE